MYEIWLVMNILWEITLDAAPWLLAALVTWLIVAALAWQRARAHWRAAMPVAVAAATIVAIASFLALPTLTRSSLGELRYWVDWANLAGLALAAGGLALAWAWPLAALWRQSRRANAAPFIAPSSRRPRAG